MSDSPDLTFAALKMLISLVVVLAVIWGLYRLARKSLPMAQGGSRGKNMRVLESQYLGLKKTITMVQIPGSILVLGVSPDQVNLLTRIDDPTLVQGIHASTGDNRGVLSFKEQLQRLTRSKAVGDMAGSHESSGN